MTGESRFKHDFARFISRSPPKRAIALRIDLLCRWLDDIHRFYPISSLVDSVQADIDTLKGLL